MKQFSYNTREKRFKRSNSVIFLLFWTKMALFVYLFAVQRTFSRTTLSLHDNYRLAAINPRDVFLFYTATENTSSAVASSLIMEAYKRQGIPVANDARSIDGSITGTFASLNHREFSVATVEKIVQHTGKPVLLVVSIRDGYDWLKSHIARAETETAKVANGSSALHDICDCFSPPKSTRSIRKALAIYSMFLPVERVGGLHGYELTYTPWSVVRHEHVVDDTCALLKRLGMDCNRDAAFGQASREQVGLDKCNYTADSNVVANVNKINEILWTERAEHAGIRRE